MSQPLLSILIPTVIGREDKFDKLKDFLEWQCEICGIANSPAPPGYEHTSQIEIISMSDNKEISIGEKRRRLYNKATGKFSWMIDDDDWTHCNAVRLILEAIKANPNADCIGFKELCIFNGKHVESSDFSLKYKAWADNTNGFNHVRTPFHKTPINTKICQAVGVKDMRFGEDHQFAKDIYSLLENEIYIDEFLYHYRYADEPHKEKYGIK